MVYPPHLSEHIQLLQHNNLQFSTDTPEDQKIVQPFPIYGHARQNV